MKKTPIKLNKQVMHSVIESLSLADQAEQVEQLAEDAKDTTDKLVNAINGNETPEELDSLTDDDNDYLMDSNDPVINYDSIDDDDEEEDSYADEIDETGEEVPAEEPHEKEDDAPLDESVDATKESQNNRMSIINDIVNAGVTLKGLGQAVPATWNRKDLSSLTNTELFNLRTSALAQATKAQKVSTESVKVSKVKKSILNKIRVRDAKRSVPEGYVLAHRKAKVNAVKEALTDKPEDDKSAELSLSICPVCGCSELDAKSGKCPVCGKAYNKYMAVESAEADISDPNNMTTINIDGDEKVLIDADGNTVVEYPDESKGVIVDNTHEINIDGVEDPISISSGVAMTGDEGDPATITDEPNGDQDATAVLVIDDNIGEVKDFLTETTDNKVETVETDDGFDLIVDPNASKTIEFNKQSPDDEELPEEIDDAEAEAVASTEADEPTMPVVDEDVPEDKPEEVEKPEDVPEDAQPIVLTLEELDNGTLVYSDGIEDVDKLVDLVSNLIPEDATISEVSEKPEDEETPEEPEEPEEPSDAADADKVVDEIPEGPEEPASDEKLPNEDEKEEA